MNTRNIIIFATILLSTSCTKVNPELKVQDREIVFQTVLSPGTKANRVEFPTSNKFISTFYYLPQGMSWDSDLYSATKIVENAVISYGDGVWKSQEHPYYWPKTGSLTFYAWTDNTPSPNIEGANVSCNRINGIEIENLNINLNRNKDIMVADEVKDATAASAINGVATIFRHILCSFSFNVKLSEEAGEQEYRIHEIRFLDLYESSTYDEDNALKWTNRGDLNEDGTIMFSNTEGVVATNTAQCIDNQRNPATDFYIHLPQLTKKSYLGGDFYTQISVTYSIWSAGAKIKTITRKAKLSVVYGVNMFEPATKYILTISLGANEVFWAPGIRDWEVKEQIWYPVTD